MKLIHTGDWHLGATLYGRSRSEEHERFLVWLHDRIVQERIDALLVAGDVFEDAAPDQHTLQLFHRFLERIAESPCRLVAIAAGERDSPALLDTPPELLDNAGVQLFTQVSNDGADEVLVLGDTEGRAQLILCAVPHLHGRQWSSEVIAHHYATVIGAAERERTALGVPVPLVVLGYLRIDTVATGGPDPLPPVPTAIFPPSVTYAAMGHVHAAQAFGEGKCGYYCGSPLPVSFDEAAVQHCVLQVELDGHGRRITPVPVPPLHRLVQIRGTVDEVAERVGRLAAEDTPAWVELICQPPSTADAAAATLRQVLDGSRLEVLRCTAEPDGDPPYESPPAPECPPLDKPLAKLFDLHDIPPDERESLLATFTSVTEPLRDSQPSTTGSEEP